MPLPEHDDKHGADGFLKLLAPLYGPMQRADKAHGCYRFHGHNYGGGRGLLFEFRRALRRHPLYCRVLGEHLVRQGHRADVAAWTGPDSHYAWLANAVGLHEEIEALLPASRRLIVVDDEILGAEFFPAHHVIPFLEQDGSYAGLPADDQHAVRELMRLREDGADCLVLAFTAFWWLETYPEFHRYLSSTFRCLARSQRSIVFDLRRDAATHDGDGEIRGAVSGGEPCGS